MADGITIKLKGFKELVSRLNGLEDDIERATKIEIRRASDDIRNGIMRKMRESGKGKRRTGSKKGSFASRPGDVPAKDIGILISSIAINIRKGGLEARVGTNVKYGKLLENGTKNIAPRPWLEPEFDKVIPLLVDRIIKRIRKAT